LVYKWCQGHSKDDPDTSGARNPLDRVAEIVNATGSTEVINWLCNRADGFYVKNPKPIEGTPDLELLQTTQGLVQQFGAMLLAVSNSIADDNEIDAREADRIRQAWEKLKATAECFVASCEQGTFRPMK
jgi:hypothetical protein